MGHWNSFKVQTMIIVESKTVKYFCSWMNILYTPFSKYKNALMMKYYTVGLHNVSHRLVNTFFIEEKENLWLKKCVTQITFLLQPLF